MALYLFLHYCSKNKKSTKVTIKIQYVNWRPVKVLSTGPVVTTYATEVKMFCSIQRGPGPNPTEQF